MHWWRSISESIFRIRYSARSTSHESFYSPALINWNGIDMCVCARRNTETNGKLGGIWVGGRLCVSCLNTVDRIRYEYDAAQTSSEKKRSSATPICAQRDRRRADQLIKTTSNNRLEISVQVGRALDGHRTRVTEESCIRSRRTAFSVVSPRRETG